MTPWQADKKRNPSPPLFQKWFRRASKKPSRINRWIYRIISFPYKAEIHPNPNIGPGLYIGHPFCITINPQVKIGKNCNIHKGVTIGQENRGPRKGAPTIGDNVWIGVNAVIVGKITIGSNVLIAPNSFINQDIPSNSIAFGNPCTIKPHPNPTDAYINNPI